MENRELNLIDRDIQQKTCICRRCGGEIVCTRHNVFFNRPLSLFMTSCPDCVEPVFVGVVYDECGE